MPEPSSAYARIAWVRKRDGRLVPFEADHISRSLFAAGERIGKPDPFMARELTDSVLHFLVAEAGGAVPATSQIADVVIKVVRELGQPALALAYAEAQAETQARDGRVGAQATGGPALPAAKAGLALETMAESVRTGLSPQELAWQAANACLRDYSLHEVYTRDLLAAQSDGLLALFGLEHPLELAGCVATTVPAGGMDVVAAVEQLRGVAGAFVVLDGPEYAPASQDAGPPADAFAASLRLALRVARLQAVVNLNCARPPAHVEELAVGPLFEEHRPAVVGPQHELREALCAQLLTAPASPVRVDWHLGKQDFESGGDGTLQRLARWALEGAALTFVFDRPRRTPALAEGLDRQHPAALLAVGLNLPQLLEQAGPEMDPPTFLRKLGSLARLALSAAKQKRDFLRRYCQDRLARASGFLLDRARLVVVPVGLEAVTQLLLGRGLCSGGSAPEFAHQVVERLQGVLQEEGRACLLDTCLDSASSYLALPAGQAQAGPCLDIRRAAGLTAWDLTATAKSQLRAAGPLHALAGTGTASVLLAEDTLPSGEEVVDLLRYAMHQTEVNRVRLVRLARAQQQVTAPWAV